jgi:outer membrane lipoprotein-sorting protein
MYKAQSLAIFLRGDYKMKKISLFFLATAVAFLAGCSSYSGTGQSDVNIYEKIQKRLVKLETYRSEATVEYKSNKGTNVYDTLQQCKAGGQYRVEVTGPKNVAGNVTLSDGKVIAQFNPKISGKISVGVKENPERSEIFLTSFIKNYLNSQEVSVTAGNFNNGKCTILEADVPGDHPYLATEKLWVDNKTLNPVKLVVYDPDLSERIVVNYNSFDYNIPLEDSLFAIPSDVGGQNGE